MLIHELLPLTESTNDYSNLTVDQLNALAKKQSKQSHFEDTHQHYPYITAKFLRKGNDFKELGFGEDWPLPVDDSKGYFIYLITGHFEGDPDATEDAVIVYFDTDDKKWQTAEISHPYQGLKYVKKPLTKKQQAK